MNRKEQNGFSSTAIVSDSSEEAGTSTLPHRNGNTSFVPEKENSRRSMRENGRLLFIGAGIVLVLLLLAFSGISRRPLTIQKKSTNNNQSQIGTQPEDTNPEPSVTPILEAGRPHEHDTDTSRVDPDQIGRLAGKAKTEAVGGSLGDIPPFSETRTWQPAPYQPGSESAMLSEGPTGSAEATESSNGRRATDKPSLVFVKTYTSSAAAERSQDSLLPMDVGIDLAAGTRLRARLESAISTAVRTPVVAVIQYNYERNGDIVVPAGTKAIGSLETADRSGYVAVHFESLLMPDGSSVGLNASAADLQLRPLRGKIEGKHVSKSILVRSLAGVGEIAATLVGRGSLNQPLSEGDLLRERVTNNIGQASDQSVANLGLTENIVISVPAATEIYVILQKSANLAVNPRAQLSVQTTSPGIDELRQLLQLQRELNETAKAKPSE